MGLIYANLKLYNSFDLGLLDNKMIKPNQVRSTDIVALVDTGAYMMCINERIQEKLQLRNIGSQKGELANGDIVEFPIVGPVEVIFENRSTSCRAMVLPGDAEPLLGSIPMEDLDVVLLPKEQKMVVNPESPLIAKKKLK
jgi:clan AA aspartic protease